jgi:phosphoglycolate phosphatase
MKYRLIVFDWDGTLSDSHTAIIECMQEASRDMGLPVPEPERAGHVIGLGMHDTMKIVAPDLPAERYPEFSAHYRRHFLAREGAMQLFPGIRELVLSLSAKRTLAIATGKSRKGLDRALAASGVNECFAASRCADETRPKPDPAMLLELMQALEVGAGEVIMIGDTSHDMEMARAARVDGLAVSYGAHPERELRACRPRGCVSSVSGLKEWLTLNG